MAGNEVKGGEKLNAYLKGIENKIMRSGVLRVGFLEGARYPAGPKTQATLAVAQVAFWNEFGTSGAPARPFMRDTISRRSGQWGHDLGKLLPAYKYDGTKALKVLGEEMVGDFQASIQAWSSPPNAPSTIAKKGFDKPLVDTSVMVRSVAAEVKET